MSEIEKEIAALGSGDEDEELEDYPDLAKKLQVSGRTLGFLLPNSRVHLLYSCVLTNTYVVCRPVFSELTLEFCD